jgi:imidazolonepropionase-like amidohydrolase
MKILTAVVAIIGCCSVAIAQDDPARTLFTNVHVFDGVSPERIENANVLVEGNLIKSVSTDPIQAEGATVIDGGGRTMTPGFIDAHVHIMLQVNYAELNALDESYYALKAADEAEKMLMRGFTTARDAAGNLFSLRRAIDEGMVTGPRIYVSGAGIGQSGGHGDYRLPNDPPKLLETQPFWAERQGMSALVDGPDEAISAAREQFRRGASQLKIFTGGGVASPNDPLDVVEMTPEEVRAVVQAAENWNTYVMTHVYNTRGIRLAVENGVKCIEHATFIDEETLDFVIKNDVWMSVQALVFVNTPAGQTPAVNARFAQALSELDNMFKLIKKKGYKKVAFGTDVIGDPALMARQNEEFTLRTKWFEPAEILRQATSGNAELLSMSGPRSPYPHPLGVLTEGAYADLLLIAGNPLDDISILEDYDANIDLIMKDGKIYKNTVN